MPKMHVSSHDRFLKNIHDSKACLASFPWLRVWRRQWFKLTSRIKQHLFTRDDSFCLNPVDVLRGRLKPGNWRRAAPLRAVGCVIAHGVVAGSMNSLETTLLNQDGTSPMKRCTRISQHRTCRTVRGIVTALCRDRAVVDRHVLVRLGILNALPSILGFLRVV